ncbi:hypothetical protein EA472_06285 [Natrarchaeobius oligotrophus]|uniref:Uncharacterized protein n=1 Tax=Natrarchaeobius chitinivorans TaxID=1679083 RepID=A0A3N6PKS4_NATCH|nr:hypothetical protein EA472_06285 [Natrarchaeobius chitinivorans]
MRLSDDGGVNFNFRYETTGDLTVDIIWRHDSGGELAYLFNDQDSIQTGFRAFTNGIAGNGLFFRNPFGGNDIFVDEDFQDGNWYQIRIVLDADQNTYTVYIDGEAVGESYYDASGFVTSDDFRIMGRKTGSSTLVDYRYFAWANNVILPDEADRIDSSLLRLDLEEGEGEQITNRGLVGVEDLLDEKRDLITQIRSNTAAFAEPSDVDVAADQFVEDTERQLDDLTTDEKKQYTEALNRLVSSERVAEEASGEPVEDIVTRTGNAVVNAMMTIGIEALTLGLGNASIAQRAVKLVGEQISGGAKATTRTITGQFAEYATKFDNLISRRSVDFGRQVDEYVDTYPRQFRENAGLTESQRRTLRDSLRDESIRGVMNVATAAGENVPDDLYADIQAIVDDTKERFNQLAFDYYWFGEKIVDDSLDFPTVSLPTEVGFTVDIPYVDIPFVDTEFDMTYEFESEKIDEAESTLDDLADRLDTLASFESAITATGIEPAMTVGVDYLEDEIETGGLEQQDPEDRENLSESGQEATNLVTRGASTVFDIIDTLTRGVMYASIMIGLAVLFIYAIVAAASLSSVVGVPAIIPSTGLLLVILGILSAIDVLIVLSRVGAIGKALTLLAHITTITTAGINTNVIEEVS